MMDTARGAAAERDDHVVVARRAAHARQAVREDAAAQVLGELALDMTRQAATVGILKLGIPSLRARAPTVRMNSSLKPSAIA
jgi:hypothetical protein